MASGSYPKGLSIDVDENHFPAIAYQSGTSMIKIARKLDELASGNCGTDDYYIEPWQCDVITTARGGTLQGDYLSLAFNPEGLPVIAYYLDPILSDGDLKIAYQDLYRVYLPVTVGD